MDPMTISALAYALGTGLGIVGGKLVEKGIIEPALEPTAKLLSKKVKHGLNHAQQDAQLQSAVTTAFAAIDAPADADQLEKYALHLGLDTLVAEGNDDLRAEVAQATLLITRPDPDLVPETLYLRLKWPHSQRQQLADFLYTLRQQLEGHEDWGALIQFSNNETMRQYLYNIADDMAATRDTLGNIDRSMHDLLLGLGIQPDTDDATALEEYINHVVQQHQTISFLFVKSERQGKKLMSGAELEAVFVPLQIQDPTQVDTNLEQAADFRQDRHATREERQQTYASIGDVLAEHNIFAIIGEPGSGKTTLLRHIAVNFARRQEKEKLGWLTAWKLPILIPLRNFGRYLEHHRAQYVAPGPKAVRRFIEHYFSDYDLKLTPNFFRERLDKGQCLLLLDGLDEVANRTLRAEVAEYVDSFMQDAIQKGNQLVLASRPEGYCEVAHYLPRDLIICLVQPLLPATRDELVINILRQFEADEKTLKTKGEALLDDIHNKERVDTLSRNPLFCTTLVLVYKYRGASLPERRVDVYHELVNLMLGFWETHRKGVINVRELVLFDGTERTFFDEDEAVEAKERALIAIADWMQQQKKAELPQEETIAFLADYFMETEGAPETVKRIWAQGFLNVAHQRSGLFVEVNPETYAFSHQNFREYLAARALGNLSDAEVVETVLREAENAWWEEVILLAFAYKPLPDSKRKLILQALLEHGHTVLAGKCAADAGRRLLLPQRKQVQKQLYTQMVNGKVPPQERLAAGDILDQLGWLPPDLNSWKRCVATADDRRDLLVQTYPVTNAQFELFIQAGGYDDPQFWDGAESVAWQTRLNNFGKNDPVHCPRHWRDVRFGRERRGVPVVGVSWYRLSLMATG